MSIKLRTAFASALVGVVALTGCATAGGGSTDSKNEVSVVGFSVMKTANKDVIADFQKTDEGDGVTFKQSYGASGDQARAIIAGLDADEAHLSLEPDVIKLTDEGLVADDWKSGPTKGILTQSVVVFVVRKDNPKGIKTWDDLVKKGVKIVTPNPGSSGSAKWNILAAYGQVISQGGTPDEASAYIAKLLGNVAALPGSAKDATTAFLGGTGDVLLSYENEAIENRAAGADFDYIVPPQTLLIQNPGVLLEGHSDAAEDFLAYQLSEAGQTDYAKQGFRPLVDSVKTEVEGANDPSAAFPDPETLLTVDEDFGGWPAADKKFFGDTTGIITKLLAESGKG